VSETYPGTTGTGGRAAVWTAIVILNSVDVTSQVVGEIRIDAEEDSARIADLTLRPPTSTAFAVASWVGKTITIDVADNATGTPASVQRLFAGVVDTPTLDLVRKTIGLRCTDNLQNVVEGMSASAIDAAIPDGYHSPVIFDAAARGWSRAQDRLSTVPASLDLTTGLALRLTPWEAATTADLTFTVAHLIDESLSVALSSRSSFINQVDIDFGYRFPRVKAEGWPVSYSYVSEATIAAHAAATNWWLQRSAVESAIKSAGGTLESITYTALPNYVIGGWTPGPSDYLLCMGFSAIVSFDYAQEIEETHTITVSAPASITAVGVLKDRLSGALVGEYPPLATAEHAMLLYANDISGIPPQDTAIPSSGYTTAADVTLTPDTDRAAADAAMETLIAVAKTKIWASHRHNTVSAAVALNPALDLDKTLAISVPGLSAKGKCRSVTHRLSPDTGAAVSEFAIAICSVAGTGVTHAETPTTAPGGSSPASTALTGSAAVDFNYLAAEDHVLTITFPGVEAVERDLAAIDLSSAYSAPLVEDVLTITL